MRPKIIFFSRSFWPFTEFGGPTVSLYSLCNGLTGRLVLKLFTVDHGLTKHTLPRTELSACTNYLDKRLYGILASFYAVRFRNEKIVFQGFFDFFLLILLLLLKIGVIKSLVIIPRGQVSPRFINTYPKKVFIRLCILLLKSLSRGKVRVHCTSKHEVEGVVSIVPQADCFLCPNPLRSDFFDALEKRDELKSNASRVGSKSKVIRLGYVGRIDSRKNLYEVLSLVMASAVKVTFCVAGYDDSPYSHQFLSDARKQLGDRFGFVGPLSSGDLIDFYRSLDATILLSDEENFGNSVLESLCCGTPVICRPNVGWLDGLLETGILPAKDGVEVLKSLSLAKSTYVKNVAVIRNAFSAEAVGDIFFNEVLE